MDNFGGIAILVLIWIVGAMFDKKKKEARRRKQQATAEPRPTLAESVLTEPPKRLPDASQREGSKLEQVLRQLNPEFAALADQALAQRHHQTATEGEPETMAPQPAEPFAAARDDGDDFMAKAEKAIARRRMTAEEYRRDDWAGRTALFARSADPRSRSAPLSAGASAGAPVRAHRARPCASSAPRGRRRAVRKSQSCRGVAPRTR